MMLPKTYAYVIVAIITITSLVATNAGQAHANTSVASEQAILAIKTTTVGLDVTDMMLQNGDTEGASHAAEFATRQFIAGLETLREIDRGTADEVHITLLDIASATNDPEGAAGQTRQDIQNTRDMLATFETVESAEYNVRSVVVGTIMVAEEQYSESGDDTRDNEAAYHIARILFADAAGMFASVADADVMLDVEQQSFFEDLSRSVEDRENFVTVGTLAGAIQRDLLGTDTTAARDHAAYFEKINNLYDQMREALLQDDYAAAQEYAIEAYLENFEYLEPILEEIDAEFMYALEIKMREDLRDMIRTEAPADDIIRFLDGTIEPDLEHAKSTTLAYLEAAGPVDTGIIGGMGSGIASGYTGLEPRAAMGDTTESAQSEVRSEIDFIRDSLHELVILYENGDYESAYVTARTAYLDSYEHIEVPLRPIAPDFTFEVEHQFAELRNAIKKQAPIEDVKTIIIEINRNLDESERLVTGTGELAPMIAFTASFAIIFREGLESVLILGAIMTYLEASRNTRFKPYVHYGVAAAVAATAVTWFVASYIIEISGASRELIEAVAALSATAVLFYVSFWILNKIEHKKWMEFVKAKVWQATTTGSVMVFVMLSFFTVYREGFETVLFYQAMFGFAKYMEMYVGLGFIVGLVSLFGVYFGMRAMGKRLPLRALFGLTMGIGAYLSIAFLGNAIRELQVLDVVSYTSMIGVIPRLDINMATMTGIYPTLETVIAQIVLLSIYVVASSYVLIVRPRKERAIAQMRQSRRKNKETKDDI